MITGRLFLNLKHDADLGWGRGMKDEECLVLLG
jgi:hypothetical protein